MKSRDSLNFFGIDCPRKHSFCLLLPRDYFTLTLLDNFGSSKEFYTIVI